MHGKLIWKKKLNKKIDLNFLVNITCLFRSKFSLIFNWSVFWKLLFHKEICFLTREKLSFYIFYEFLNLLIFIDLYKNSKKFSNNIFFHLFISLKLLKIKYFVTTGYICKISRKFQVFKYLKLLICCWKNFCRNILFFT